MRGGFHERRAGGGVDGWLARNNGSDWGLDERASDGDERELRMSGVGIENEGRVCGVGTGEDGGIHWIGVVYAGAGVVEVRCRKWFLGARYFGGCLFDIGHRKL